MTPFVSLARSGAALLLGLAFTFVQAADPPSPLASAPAAALDGRMQDLKAEAARLNRDLQVLEEELLFPPGTQLALFLSLDAGPAFELESVRVTLDDKLIAAHVYSAPQVQALRSAGVQRLYLGNLRGGRHQLAASFSGRWPAEGGKLREGKGSAALDFEKGNQPRHIELRIRGKDAKEPPEFEVKFWQ